MPHFDNEIFEFTTIKPIYKNQVIDLLSRRWVTGEPVTVTLKQRYNDVYPVIKRCVEKTMREDLNLVIIEKKKNLVVFACLAEDYFTSEFDPYYTDDDVKNTPSFKVIVELF